LINTAIFDLDGTLVVIKIDYAALRGEVLQTLKEFGVPDSLLDERRVLVILENVRNYLASRNEVGLFVEIKNKIYSIVDDYEINAAKMTEIIPGTVEALKFVKERGFKMGLCSVSGEKAASLALDRFQLKSFFDAVITREYTPKPKPFVDHLETVLKTLHAKPNESVVVGDSIIDMIPAKALNILAVGVSSGVFARSPEELSKAGATYIIPSIKALPELLVQILEPLPD